ncbi:MAG: chain-length determining protein [Gammaproteobacteria bacterium]|nr:chain-length determining protein [Gammaproteobacteria bacterium]
MDLRQLTSDLVEDGFGMWRYRWHALAVAWVAALAGWVWVLTLPNQYDATARVYVDTETMLKPLLRDLTVNTDTLSDVALVTEALLSQPQLKSVALETGLERRATTPEELERLLTGLKRTISIQKQPKQDIFNISYRDYDPEMARNVVQVLLTTFMENSLSKNRKNSVNAQQFLGQQIKLYEQRLEEAEDRLATFKKANVGLMPGEGGDYFARLATAEAALRQTQSEVSALQERRNELQRQVEGEEPVIGMSGSSAAAGGTSVDGAIADLESQLADLRVKFTDKHPDVVRVNQTLQDLYKVRDSERQKSRTTAAAGSPLDGNPVYQQMRVSLSATEVELASARSLLGQRQAAVANLKRSVDTIPEVEAQLNRLNRDYNVVKAQYDALVQRLESARLSEEVQADKEQVTFDVIEPPRLPLFPTAPNRFLLYSLVLAAALIAGAATAFFLNQHNPVFYSGRKLRAATGLPIFGYVSVTRARQFGRAEMIFAGAMAGLVLAFLILMVAGVSGLSSA